MYVCMYHMITTHVFDIHCIKWFHFCCHPPLGFERQFSKTPPDTLLLRQVSCRFSPPTCPNRYTNSIQTFLLIKTAYNWHIL